MTHMIKDFITWTEKTVLLVIALYATGAVATELISLYQHPVFELQNMLQLFIYAEVLGMVAAFFGSHNHTIPIKIPLFIAITAICRLMILQNKEHDASVLIYESISILLIATAAAVLSRIKSDTD